MQPQLRFDFTSPRHMGRVTPYSYVTLGESELWCWEHSRHSSLEFKSECSVTYCCPTHCGRGPTKGLSSQKKNVFPI